MSRRLSMQLCKGAITVLLVFVADLRLLPRVLQKMCGRRSKMWVRGWRRLLSMFDNKILRCIIATDHTLQFIMSSKLQAII
jgi:hypothetical protein